MSMTRSLSGGCACGRNEYVITVPSSSVGELQVLLDNSSLTRRHTTAPFTPFLRVPLDWYRSATFAFFADETHRAIKRTFASADGPVSQRHFCGFCGTQLTAWSDRMTGDAGYIDVTLGSLVDDDVAALEEWGLLSTEEEGEDGGDERTPSTLEQSRLPMQQAAAQRPVRGMSYRGTPWFEDMVEHSRLGRIRHQWGGYESEAGSKVVRWEVVELANDGTELLLEEPLSRGWRKRKASAGGTSVDQEMGE